MSEFESTTPYGDVAATLGLGNGAVLLGTEGLQFIRGARFQAGRLAVLLAAVTWLPLLTLSIIEGVAWGHAVHVPFVMDYLP